MTIYARRFPETVRACERWISDYVLDPSFDVSKQDAESRKFFEQDLQCVAHCLELEIELLKATRTDTAVSHTGGVASLAGLLVLKLAIVDKLGPLLAMFGGLGSSYAFGRELADSRLVENSATRIESLKVLTRTLEA